MWLGISIFVTDQSIRPDEIAREVEDRGFRSIWFPEHSHIPVSRETPWGGKQGAPPLPDYYGRTLDTFVALSYAASATTKLRLGGGISLVAQRDPIWTAKEVATLDHLSGGRVEFGIGYGWNKEEMGHHGVAYSQRRAVLREKVLLMKSLWTEDEAEFRGEHLVLEPSWAWPKPVQEPHPPILMGAEAGPRTIADMVEFCDGWLPLATRHDIEGQVERVRSAVAEAGRDPDRFRIVASSARPEQLDQLRELGADGAILGLPSRGRDEVLRRLDELATSVAHG
jgi:probable F420-dependent oxidoreductase